MNTKRISLKRLNGVLFAILMLSLIMHLGRLFLIPVAIAALFAMLLYPLAKQLEDLKWSRSMAALCAIIVLLLALTALIVLVQVQVSSLKTELPQIEQEIKKKTDRLKWTISKETGVTKNEQENLIEDNKSEIVAGVTSFLKNSIIDGLYVLLMFFVVIAYTFLYLIYRRRIRNFFIQLNLFNEPREADKLLTEISQLTYQYLKGIVIVISILAVIYALGFWIIGIKHALLFAIVTAMLRIIPYIGSFAGIGFTIGFAFLTLDSVWYPVAVLVFFMVIQLFEAYLLTPMITGKKVKLNPLATIFAILLGSLIWGVAGMVLFVPLFGILKVFFDRIPQLSPIGYVLSKEE